LIQEVVMEYSNIILDRHDQYASVTLNRPDKLNAINYEVLSELGQAMDEINEMAGVRVVVIKGAGRAFSSGTDLQALGSGTIDRTRPGYRYHLGRHQEVYSRIERLEKPVIAQIHGYALGGAMELALACDFRIASKDTRFSLPEVRYGIIPDLGGCQRLVRALGLLRAKELVMMGRTIDGAEAERIGLINRAVEPEGVEDEVRKWAEELLGLPPLAVGLGKRMVDKGLDMDILSSLEVNAQVQSMLLRTEDFAEAMQARKEKRRPEFKGK
jgi:enoyl-CoA hydratase/carnithine racemase